MVLERMVMTALWGVDGGLFSRGFYYLSRATCAEASAEPVRERTIMQGPWAFSLINDHYLYVSYEYFQRPCKIGSTVVILPISQINIIRLSFLALNWAKTHHRLHLWVHIYFPLGSRHSTKWSTNDKKWENQISGWMSAMVWKWFGCPPRVHVLEACSLSWWNWEVVETLRGGA